MRTSTLVTRRVERIPIEAGSHSASRIKLLRTKAPRSCREKSLVEQVHDELEQVRKADADLTAVLSILECGLAINSHSPHEAVRLARWLEQAEWCADLLTQALGRAMDLQSLIESERGTTGCASSNRVALPRFGRQFVSA